MIDNFKGTSMAFWLATSLNLLLATIGIYDAWVTLSGHNSPTVSDVVKAISASFPVVSFLAGFLAGHLWF